MNKRRLTCAHCSKRIPKTMRRDAKFCDTTCRSQYFRALADLKRAMQ